MGCPDQAEVMFFMFVWLIPSAGFAVVLGFSEQFGYDLRGCQPEMAPWLRGVLLQYLIAIFLVMYFMFLPYEYVDCFKRFTKSTTWYTLIGMFIVEQLVIPWITLVLHLGLRSACGDRMTQGQSIFYWIVFSLQAMLFLMMIIYLLVFYSDIEDLIVGPRKLNQKKHNYAKQVLRIIRGQQDMRRLYGDLLQNSVSFEGSLFQEDLIMFRILLRRRLSKRCVEIVRQEQRICFHCKGGFSLFDSVHYMEHCGHLAHWECFESVITQKGQCSECRQSSLAKIKKAIYARPARDLEQQLLIPPCVSPTFLAITKAPPRNPKVPPRIFAIEYCTYTVDQKTGGEPAEALPAPVAETEI